MLEWVNFSFYSVNGWGIDLDYSDTEWFTLETNRDHSVIFEMVPKYCISDSLVDYGASPFPLLRGISSISLREERKWRKFLPTVVDIMVI